MLSAVQPQMRTNGDAFDGAQPEAAPAEDEAAAEAPEAALPEPTLELGDPDEEDLARLEAEWKEQHKDDA